MAYSNSDVRGQGSRCVLWFHDLLDIRQVPNGGQDLYIRIEASKQGACFDKVFFPTDNFSLNNKLGEGGFGPVYKVNFQI